MNRMEIIVWISEFQTIIPDYTGRYLMTTGWIQEKYREKEWTKSEN